jgi:hypothetical protein
MKKAYADATKKIQLKKECRLNVAPYINASTIAALNQRLALAGVF